ncbi:hypothetical protein KEM54_005241, partial [Ascosphaera aggregata]
MTEPNWNNVFNKINPWGRARRKDAEELERAARHVRHDSRVQASSARKEARWAFLKTRDQMREQPLATGNFIAPASLEGVANTAGPMGGAGAGVAFIEQIPSHEISPSKESLNASIFDSDAIDEDGRPKRHTYREWAKSPEDSAKAPPSRFQKRANSTFATMASRDGHRAHPNDRDIAYFEKLRQKSQEFVPLNHIHVSVNVIKVQCHHIPRAIGKDHAMKFPTVYNVYVLCGFATVGGLLFGFDISSMSGKFPMMFGASMECVIGTRGYTNYFGVSGGGYKQGGITSAMAWGSLVGSFCASWLADHLSRVTTLQIAAVCWIIGSVFMCASNGLALLIVGRIICGLGVGMASTVVPIYQAEVAPREIRGGIISLQQWAITWGIMIQYFIQYGCSFIGGGPNNPDQGTASFRIPWGIQIVPGVIFLGGLLFFPKSPRWLAGQDRWEETMEVLARLHGKGNSNDPKVLAEYKEIEDVMIAERENEKATWFDLAKPRNLKRVSL